MGDKLVSSLDPYYAETAFVLTILGYQKNTLDSKLEVGGFYLDSDPSTTNLTTPTSGCYKRGLLTNDSDVIRVSAAIYTPFQTQPRVLAPMTKVTVSFYLHDDTYVLKSAVPNADFKYRTIGSHMTFKKMKTTSDYQ